MVFDLEQQVTVEATFVGFDGEVEDVFTIRAPTHFSYSPKIWWVWVLLLSNMMINYITANQTTSFILFPPTMSISPIPYLLIPATKYPQVSKSQILLIVI